jgi:hypothetical protein
MQKIMFYSSNYRDVRAKQLSKIARVDLDGHTRRSNAISSGPSLAVLRVLDQSWWLSFAVGLEV